MFKIPVFLIWNSKTQLFYNPPSVEKRQKHHCSLPAVTENATQSYTQTLLQLFPLLFFLNADKQHKQYQKR